jgi:putative transposase
VRYAFVAAHRRQFRLTTMCRVLRMHRSGFYAWMKTPRSQRSIEDERLLGKIRTFYQASDGVYGSPRVHRDLREDGERCGEHKVARLMRVNRIRAVCGYKRPRFRAGKPALVAPNRLEQNFSAEAPDRVWATDITYIRTFEGWLYLSVVVDLYSRIVIGWSMKSTMARDLVLDALLMAVWRRRPKQSVIVHSDQGSQYGSDDAVRFFKDHNLIPSMSRRGNCFDNAVAESFFSSLKKERIRRRIYRSREEARADVFDYIEVFYNRVRRHSHLGHLSPHDFEQATLNQA